MSLSKLDALSAIRDDRTLGRFAKFVFAMLLSHADGAGFCFPGIDTLADECGLGRTTVVSALEELERSGWLRRERRGRSGGAGGRTSNGYHLSPPDGSKLVKSAPRLKGGDLSSPREGLSTAARGGFRPPGDQEAGQGSWSEEASPKAPASGGSARVAKTPFPESFAPDAESLALAHKRGVAASDAVRVLRELATANGWRKACWQAAYRAHLLTMPDRPSGVRSTDAAAAAAADQNAVNSAIGGVLSAAYGVAAQAKARTLVGPDLGRFALAAERAWRDRPRLVAT